MENVLYLDELVLSIFEVSSLRTLFNLSQSCQRFLSLLGLDSLWKERVRREFDLVNDKYKGMTFREQYISLIRIPSLTEARLDQWKVLERKGVHPTPHYINVAKDHKVVEWLKEKGFIRSPMVRDVVVTDERGLATDPEIDSLLKQSNLRDGISCSLSRYILASNRIDWMTAAATKFGMAYLKSHVVGFASITAYKWLLANHYVPGHKDMSEAAKYGKWDVFLWLESLGHVPTEPVAGIALAEGNLEMLKHCYKKGYRLNARGSNIAIASGYFEALEWLACQGRLPDQVDIMVDIEYGCFDFKEWFILNGGEWSEQ